MFHQRFLQRYMPGNRAIQVLKDDGFYFRRIDGYSEDPTEGDREYFGTKEKLILESLNSRFPGDSYTTQEEAEQLCRNIMLQNKEKIFIQSWFWHKQMSKFMWESYGRSSDSADCALFIVDRFKLGSYLIQVLPTGCRFGPVKYTQNKYLQREAVFTKHIEFEPECEFRASIDVGELIYLNKNILPEFNWPPRHMELYREDDPGDNLRNRGVACEHHFVYRDEKGFVLKAPLADLLEAVYIPVNASEDFCVQLDELLALKGCNFKCQRIELPSE